MNIAELAQLKRKELLEIARGQKVRNAARYCKADLVEQIVKHQQASESYRSTKAQKSKKSPKSQKLSEAKEVEISEVGKEATTAVLEEEVVQPPKDYPQQPEAQPVFSLPYSYNVTKIVLMVRDPFWAYTYWDVDEVKYKEINHLLQSKSGSIRTIVRTYDVTNVDFNGSNAHRIFDTDVTLDARGWYINLGVPGRDYCVDLGLLDDRGNFYLIARSNIMRTPRDSASDEVDDNWMVRDFDEIYSLSGGIDVGLSSGELRRKKRLLFEQVLSSGAVSSSPGLFMKEEKAPKKDFFLEVDTELILYGRTKADANVTIGGKEVPLRPDGTFSIRFHLPDGKRNLPVVAVSSDKDDRRKITVDVQKNTQ